MKSARYTKDAINNRLSLYSSTSTIPISGLKPLKRRFPGLLSIASTEGTSDTSVLDCCPLDTDSKGNFVDKHGRKVTLKGINVDGSMKLPAEPNLPSYKGDSSKYDDIFFDGDNVTFVGRPFPLDEAHLHFLRIKSWGYNTIRYLLTWEAIEHAGPGKYDDEFVDYTIKILSILHEVGGLYVFLEMHQDVWSRFSGGSGAPMWTLYAAGLQPTRFSVTEAAIIHNDSRFHDDEALEMYHKMIWASNYKRLATMVMFTLFFSGRTYFPGLVINGQNIQDYLQDHYLNAIAHIWKAVNQKLPEMIKDGTIIGFELMNEPNRGLIGHEDLSFIPGNQQLRVGTTPTVYQSMRLGMGFPCEVDEYRIALTGPQKFATRLIDPKGQRSWLSVEEAKVIDKKYGWKRGPKWKMGECIFAREGIWRWDKSIDFENFANLTEEKRLDISIGRCELRYPNHFNQVSKRHNHCALNGIMPSTINSEYFINNNFVEYYAKFKKIIRDISPDVFVFIQPPVLDVPPNLKDDPSEIIDKKTVYCPHYYDGMSLMFKTWNTKYNVDTLGIMRGRYLNPVLGIVFGERAIRNCIKKQFVEMKREAEEFLGNIPVLMSETGMPFDMDDKRSYGNGKYISQTAALDAISNGLESLNMSHTYWCYTSINCHEWGDRWNNEDFSFWSSDDRNNQNYDDKSSPATPQSMSRRGSIIKTINLKSRRASDAANMIKTKIQRAGLTPKSKLRPNTETSSSPEAAEKESDDENTDSQSIQDSSLISTTSENVQYKYNRKCFASPDGVRATNAVIRPFVVATKGDIVGVEFDYRAVKFGLSLFIDKSDSSLINTPTIIFVPKWHFPFLNYGDIYLSSGHIKYNESLEYLEWYHDGENLDAETNSPDGVETIIIKNNSGLLDENKVREQGILPYVGELKCPTT
ncbi:glycoside hydrolase family 5 protein [Suhomyces tanzawaensis NRRL Y-17324]|uniref:Glycoside hydrolase family 5 protein n=1 Tax=Suhomyces tanzawaensis NRRL Y-17324 TaxID=984487 RepID=A0A1E4SLP3_9ASCO|nr:glycoside hydrolase family 5 protein [Suhomyces tanzawaensis NRRL Y-17324]ODV80317.1 glycoside hydrolase family 5 protein [Suhomyces tanzawaensis NRRL Y-17324]